MEEIYQWIKVGFWELHLTDERVVFSESARVLFGLEPDFNPTKSEILNFPTSGADRERFSHALSAAIDSGIPFDIDLRMSTASGVEIWLHALGKIEGNLHENKRLVGIFQDITHRKLTEDQFRKRASFLGNIAEKLPAMLGYWTCDLICLFANERYRNWFGKTAAETPGMHMQDFLGRDLFLKDEPFILKTLAGERSDFERTLIKYPGEVIYTWINLIPDLENNQVKGFVVLISEMTKIKIMQVELLRLNMELEARTKQAEAANEAKNQFLANMSHELRTPISGIVSMAALLSEEIAVPDQQSNLSIIRRSGEKMLHLLAGILDTAKIEAGRLVLEDVTFNLADLMRDVMAVTANSVLKKRLQVTVEIPPDLPEQLLGDAGRIWQILTNLMNNAVKFTEHGSINLKAAIIERHEASLKIRFAVKDSGIGINPQMHSQIFSPFVQGDSSTTRKYGGTGLGLSISKQLVELMGGEIGVKSEPGHGSLFWFIINLKRHVLKPSQGGKIPENFGPQVWREKPPRILIVDDDTINQSIMQAMLWKMGYAPEMADNGEEAVRKLSQGGYDLILMDYMMPVMDGLEATGVIRGGKNPLIDKNTPIIIWTANALPDFPAICLARGANAVLIKPSTKEQLEETIRKYIHKSGTM